MGRSVRTLKLLLCATLLIVTTLLVTDVLDLCRVLPSGEVTFEPRVEHSALRRWATSAAEFFSPGEEAPAAAPAAQGPSTPVLASQSAASARR